MKESLSRMLGFSNNHKNNMSKYTNWKLLRLEQIHTNHKQFDSIQLDELARSIQEHGVIQPIIVRQLIM